MLFVLALVSAIAPLSMDMYLPGLPTMADSLGTSASSIQLTLTTFTAGLGIGQLLVGPVSDGTGRRRILLGAAAITTLAAVGCALAPSIEFLIGARLIHGLSGGAAIVVARACVADRARGDQAARLFSLLMMIGGVAPVVAPLLGGAMLGPIGWRGIFWVLAALGVVMVVGGALLVPETLPRERRTSGGLRALTSNIGSVVTNRRYLGYALGFMLAFGAMFSYISASSFVIQNVLGLSPGQYSLAFAINATGMVATTFVNSRLLGRFHARQLLLTGMTGLLAGGLATLAVVLVVDTPPWWAVLVPLFVTMSSMGMIFGNSTGLAQSEVPHAAGTGSALMGAGQFLLAAVVSPIVGVAGPETAVPMAIAIPAFALLALCSAGLLARGNASSADHALLAEQHG
ncbi:multidrug effflux MFS transporter [Rhodococcus sp. HNM0569]|uniref:multidrug effflux MFS transporter n=1 Tax=Rhodococcus sp. HNM0569 TaxID=2716340 RepID=UPI00146AADAE|nr:multidrug effflux MFS transporter [Rhodococcus sp. HNM0569]NLU81527.1 multidrug effflux MFS transporter [Rhodococcus sp. HNM0569]